VGEPRIDQINVVVKDVEAVASFLNGLGLELPAAPPGWEAHHRTIPSATSLHVGHDLDDPAFGIDLDSPAFAQRWGGLDTSFGGVVINIRVDGRGDVDHLHERALSIGGRSLKRPYDAFWGSRYAVVEGPGPMVLGFMSVPDSTLRSRPPDPESLG
jgi:predicted lactoylglutathione lyase